MVYVIVRMQPHLLIVCNIISCSQLVTKVGLNSKSFPSQFSCYLSKQVTVFHTLLILICVCVYVCVENNSLSFCHVSMSMSHIFWQKTYSRLKSPAYPLFNHSCAELEQDKSFNRLIIRLPCYWFKPYSFFETAVLIHLDLN